MRVRHVRALSPEEQSELNRLVRDGHTHSERRRAQFILLSAAGHHLKQAALDLGMARSTAGRTLRAFEAGGVRALREPHRTGRPPRLTPEIRRVFDQALQQSPREHGFPTNSWTAPLAATYLASQHGVILSADQTRNWMRALGFRRVKPRPRLAKGDADAK